MAAKKGVFRTDCMASWAALIPRSISQRVVRVVGVHGTMSYTNVPGAQATNIRNQNSIFEKC